MLLRGAFTALILLTRGLSAAVVVPPANVTVRCQNVNVTVKWDYPNLQAQTSFRVSIRGAAEDYDAETTELQHDLSSYVWDKENYMEFLCVTVTAVQGGNQSEAVLSNSFTFNRLKPVDTKCALDFPPVDVNVGDSGLTVHFVNPFNFYKELKQTAKPDGTSGLQFFVYPVTDNITRDGKTEGFCSVEEQSCKLDVTIPDGLEKCVTVKGVLFQKRQVDFRETAKKCAYDSHETDVIMFAVILLSVLVVTISLILFFIWNTKAWKIEIPRCLKPDILGQKLDVKYIPASREDVSPVTIDATPKTVSDSSENIHHSNNLQHSSTDSNNRPGYTEKRLSESSSQEYEGNGTDDDSADDSEKTECISLDMEAERSPYDMPRFVELDMGCGDMATGYTGK